MLSMVKKLMKELGRKPTRDEIWAEQKRDTDDMLKRVRSTPVENYNNECYEYMGSGLHIEYIATGASSNQEFTEHLAECQACLSDLTKRRGEFLSSNSADCLTVNEQEAIRKTGLEPQNRKDHTDKCYHCWIVLRECEEEHLSSQSGPECLTRDNLHTIHTTGEIPDICKPHIENCLRCHKEAEKNRDAYIDQVIPQPKLPKRRFESIRAKYKNQTTT